jgi:hypothetical protein
MFKSIFKNLVFIIFCINATSFANTTLSNSYERSQKLTGNVDIFGTALYWIASETADWAATITQFPNVERIAYKPISFDWSAGLRTGIGHNFQTDNWNTQVSYTRFTTNSTDKASGTIHSAFFGQTVSLVGYFQTASVEWKINYNMFDWNLSRFFSISKSLSVYPSIGLKGGWIDQKIKSKWSKPELFFILLAQENLKNNFTGLGPQFGIKNKWKLANIGVHSISLVSEAFCAFLWGHWMILDQFQDNFLVTVKTIVKDRTFIATCLQTFIGFGWDSNFTKIKSHFALNVGYEIQDWLNQFQIFDDASGGNSNDLVLQGLTITMLLDF